MKFTELILENQKGKNVQWATKLSNILLDENNGNIYVPINNFILKELKPENKSLYGHVTNLEGVLKLIKMQNKISYPISAFKNMKERNMKRGVTLKKGFILILKAYQLISSNFDLNSKVDVSGYGRFVKLSTFEKINNWKHIKYINKVKNNFFSYREYVLNSNQPKNKQIALIFNWWKKEILDNKETWKELLNQGSNKKLSSLDFEEWDEYIINDFEILEICVEKEEFSNTLEKENLLKICKDKNIKLTTFDNYNEINSHILNKIHEN